MFEHRRIWPREEDRRPLVANFHVARSPLTASQEDYKPGTTCITVTEQPEAIEERLADQYLLYRITQSGKKLLKFAGEQHEV